MSFGTDCAEELEMQCGDDFYYAHRGGKDAEKFQKAEAAYASTWADDEEELVLVYDATIFGSADEGVALSTKHVFYKNDIDELSLSFEYGDFDDVAVDYANHCIVLQSVFGEPMAIAKGGYRDEAREKLAMAIRFMKETVSLQRGADSYDTLGMQEPMTSESAPVETDFDASRQTPVAQPSASAKSKQPPQPSKMRSFLSWADTAFESAVQAQAQYTAGKTAPTPSVSPKRAQPPTLGSTASAVPQAQAATCAACGAKLMPNAKFCSACGTPVPPADAGPRRCQVCGAELTENAAFCSQCGYPVEG